MRIFYIRKFLNQKNDSNNTKVIKLEQNYRSTQNILDTASSLISNNDDRLGKKLWSENCYTSGLCTDQ